MQLLAAIANDAEHMPSLLYSLRGVVTRPEASDDGDVWGVGYYADDRALTIHKPGEILTSRQFHDLAPEVKSQVLLAFVHRGTSATHHAPPHRFRRWLFGAVGDLSPLEAMRSRIDDRIPGFIRSDVGDAQPSELAFAMFLREQHERGTLGDPLATGQHAADAMKRATDAMRMLAEEAGIEPPVASYAATNGRVIIVSRQGPAVSHMVQRGLEALPEGPPDPAMTDFKMIVQALKRFRAVVFAAAVEAGETGWTEVPLGETVWVDRQLSVASA